MGAGDATGWDGLRVGIHMGMGSVCDVGRDTFAVWAEAERPFRGREVERRVRDVGSGVGAPAFAVRGRDGGCTLHVCGGHCRGKLQPLARGRKESQGQHA